MCFSIDTSGRENDEGKTEKEKKTDFGERADAGIFADLCYDNRIIFPAPYGGAGSDCPESLGR